MTFDADDRIEFVADTATGSTSTARPAWRVLIVDDDPDVHEITERSLGGLLILGRGLSFLHAHSATEAERILAQQPGICVVLLDVVMEDQEAGLRLVGRIRHELGLQHTRIILRTGQPGYAPEIDAIRDYDINDYKTKSELTRGKLFTSLTTAIRSYAQITQLDASRRGLELIIQASHQFIAQDGLQPFAVGVITQLAALIGVQADGLVCAQALMDSRGTAAAPDDYVVIAAAGRFAPLVRQTLDQIDDARVRGGIARCLASKRTLIEDDAFILHFPGRDGQHFAAFIDTPHPPGEPDQHLLEVFCTNIAMCAENIQLVSRLQDTAYSDRLVQLPNRAAFVEAIDTAMSRPDPTGQVVALLDIDQFAETNEAFGYAYGDALLRAVARRLQAGFADTCRIARISNDTFGLVGPTRVLEPNRLLSTFASPFVLPEGEHCATASAGLVVLGTGAGKSARGAVILENCYQALKHAKSSGHGSHAWYTPEFGHAVRDRTRLLQDLRQAFAQQSLHLVYQPQVDLADGRPLGLEALMRWQSPDGCFVATDRFIPIAEQSGLIGALGDWALRTALRQLQSLRAAGHLELRMAVNVSALQFLNPGFADHVLQAVTECKVPPDRLELEITESVAMADPSHAETTMGRLKAMGVGLAIDDFGTGFSSLSYLDRLPVDRLKIDRSFVASARQSGDASRIASMIVGLGHALGLRVVAEGVETSGQALWLRGLGCDEAQGFHFSYPMAGEQILAWLNSCQPTGAIRVQTA